MAEIISAKTRNTALDGCKFFLVCLVVVGHAIEPSRYEIGISSYLYSIIYLFHMPLFVMLSGYFTNNENMSYAKWRLQAIRLIETYCWVTLFTIICTSGDIMDILSPRLSSWYLLSLLFWRTIVYLLCNAPKKILLLISFFVSAIAFLVPIEGNGDFLALYRTFQFFPFFCLGYCLRAIGLNFLKQNKCRVIFTLLSLLAIFLIRFFDDRTLHLICFRRDSILEISKEVNYSISYVFITKLFVGCASLVMSFALLSNSNVFQKIGSCIKDTMTIFVLQAIIIHAIIYRVPALLSVEFILSFLVIVFGCLVSRHGYGQILSNPITSLISLKNV